MLQKYRRCAGAKVKFVKLKLSKSCKTFVYINVWKDLNAS